MNKYNDKMKIKEDLVLRRVGDEYLIIVPNNGSVDMTEVYTLNETSAWIWEQLGSESFSVEKIVDLLQERFDVDREKALQDAQALVDVLREGKLIVQD